MPSPITTLTARGVVENGSLPINYVPSVQDQHLAVGTDGRVVCNVVGSNGVAIDLTGCACILSIKQSPSDAVPLIARLGVVTNAAGGIVEFAFSANDTIPLGAGNFIYDVNVTFGDSTTAQVVPTSAFILDVNPGVGSITPTIQLPTIQGQTGKFLSNNGTNLQWANTNGTFNPTPDWTSGTDYAVNDVTPYGGSVYRCKVPIPDSTTPPPMDPTHWQLWAGAAGIIVSTGGALASDGEWVELARYTPGVNRQGFCAVSAKGNSSAPSRIAVWDQLSYRTNGDGAVFLQSPRMAGIGGPRPDYAGPGIPSAPTNVVVTQPTPGTIRVTWDAGSGCKDGGTLLEFWNSGFVAFSPTGYVLGAGVHTLDVKASEGGFITSGETYTVRAMNFNDFGEAPSAFHTITPSANTPDDGGGPNGWNVPLFPVANAQYDDVPLSDLVFPWNHVFYMPGAIDTPPGDGGNIQIQVIPAIPLAGGSVKTDVLFRARTQGSKTGGVSLRADLTNGPVAT